MIKCLLLFVGIVNVVNSANILGITIINSHSHHLWNEVLAVALAEKGHNVTLLSHDHKNVQHDNYHLLYIEGGYEDWGDFELEKTAGKNAFMDAPSLWNNLESTCEKVLKSNAFKALENYPPDYKFDLILLDLTAGECLYPIIKRFGNPPVVGVSVFGLQPYMSWYLGGHIYSYAPFYGGHYSNDMTLLQKLNNVIQMNYHIYLRQTRYIPASMEVARKHFGQDIGDFYEIDRSIALGLFNFDPNFDYPVALPPNMIMVGGLQVARTKPLNKEFQKIFDESKEDIIYFSLGLGLKSEKLDGDVLQSFIKCFETLPNTILWKIDSKDIKLPKNVITKKWMPQSDILAHPKTKLFISHGGALGTQEAMYHGVPVIGVPFFLDQINNVKKLVAKNVGIEVEFDKINPDYVCGAIKEGLKPRYYKNMQLISKRVKDQITTPLERAVFSVEYVLRHGGADHLSSAVRNMTIFQSQNLDLICVVLGIVLLPVVLLWIIIKKCCKKTVKVKRN